MFRATVKRRVLPAAILLAVACHSSGGPAVETVPGGSPTIVIPQPFRVQSAPGVFVFDQNTAIIARSDFAPLGVMLASYLRPATGLPLTTPTGAGAAARNLIILQRDVALATTLGDEGYRLEVTPSGIRLTAAQAAGAFYGLQTLRQLLPPEVFSATPVSGIAWEIPAITIEDKPRFRWRGSHLDVSRHFMPVEFVKKHLDLMALHKLNSFHWHLTDDQGWRLEIKKYPRLTEVGAWRSETLVGGMRRNLATATYDGVPHGGFYTQEQVREIVEYAKARFINVVPEIEMPGHAQAVIAAYPRMASTSATVEVRKVWGVSEHLLNPSDSTISFLKDVLEEVLQLFPSDFIHIGGDEATKTEWRTHPIARARMQQQGLQNEEELQSWFIHQFDEFLAGKKRRLVGWDEILEGGLAPNAVVMSWRGVAGGIEAARSSHDVIMTPTSHTYFDYYQSRDPGEPLAIGGFLPLDSVYAYEPIPAELEPQFVKHILGAQAQLWTEYMPDGKHVEYMAWPRLSALAEVVWSPKALRDLPDFRRRLPAHLRRLEAIGVNYRRGG